MSYWNQASGDLFRSTVLKAMTVASTVYGGIVIPPQTIPQTHSDQLGIRRPRAEAELSLPTATCFEKVAGLESPISERGDLQNCVSHSASATKVVLVTGAVIVVAWLIYAALWSLQSGRT